MDHCGEVAEWIVEGCLAFFQVACFFVGSVMVIRLLHAYLVALAGHDPSGEIGSITAKVDDGTAAIEPWVGEPFEELGVATDLDGALEAIVNDDFADRPMPPFSTISKAL
jgi:hypothetical protein